MVFMSSYLYSGNSSTCKTAFYIESLPWCIYRRSRIPYNMHMELLCFVLLCFKKQVVVDLYVLPIYFRVTCYGESYITSEVILKDITDLRVCHATTKLHKQRTACIFWSELYICVLTYMLCNVNIYQYNVAPLSYIIPLVWLTDIFV